MPSTMPTESRSLSSLERTESSLFQILFHVPSSSQALSLLQAVAYAPYLLGSSLHCAPVRNIQRTPLSVFRSLALGLPPFAKFCLGNRGSRTAHCLSVKAVIDYQLSIKREVLKYLLVHDTKIYSLIFIFREEVYYVQKCRKRKGANVIHPEGGLDLNISIK